VSAFGYGSSYSFKTGDYNPGFTQGMGQDPRQIVAKSGIDSMKSGLPSGQSAAPAGSGADPYGINFNPQISSDPGGVSSNQNVQNFLDPNYLNMTPAGQLAYSAMPGAGFQFDNSKYAAGDLGGIYQGAFNQLAFEGQGSRQPGVYEGYQQNLKNKYQQWLDQMLRGGSFGLTGGGLSYGQGG